MVSTEIRSGVPNYPISTLHSMLPDSYGLTDFTESLNGIHANGIMQLDIGSTTGTI